MPKRKGVTLAALQLLTSVALGSPQIGYPDHPSDVYLPVKAGPEFNGRMQSKADSLRRLLDILNPDGRSAAPAPYGGRQQATGAKVRHGYSPAQQTVTTVSSNGGSHHGGSHHGGSLAHAMRRIDTLEHRILSMEAHHDKEMKVYMDAIAQMEDDINGAFDRTDTLEKSTEDSFMALIEIVNALERFTHTEVANNSERIANMTALFANYTECIDDLKSRVGDLEDTVANPYKLFGNFSKMCETDCWPEKNEDGFINHYPYINGGYWQLVRRVAGADCAWHPATDQLAGTEEYGKFCDDTKANSTFSRKFDDIDFDDFLFMTGDESQWLVASRESVIGETYEHALRDVRFSSSSLEPYTAYWHNGAHNMYDPHVAVKPCYEWGCDLEKKDMEWEDMCLVYLGNGFTEYNPPKDVCGANVFIRKRKPTSSMCNVCRSMFLCANSSLKEGFGNNELCVG